jgi:hypothetical protein
MRNADSSLLSLLAREWYGAPRSEYSLMMVPRVRTHERTFLESTKQDCQIPIPQNIISALTSLVAQDVNQNGAKSFLVFIYTMPSLYSNIMITSRNTERFWKSITRIFHETE